MRPLRHFDYSTRRMVMGPGTTYVPLGVAGMVSWRMPDGTEIVGVGVEVETERLREFVMRFMSAAGAGWNASQWSDTLFGSAFEERFGVKVQVHRESGPDGQRVFAIRTLSS